MPPPPPKPTASTSRESNKIEWMDNFKLFKLLPLTKTNCFICLYYLFMNILIIVKFIIVYNCNNLSKKKKVFKTIVSRHVVVALP